MGSNGLGLLLEEYHSKIATEWRRAVAEKLGTREPALNFAVTPLLRELIRALDAGIDAVRTREGWKRCAVLIRSSASPGQLAREFNLIHRCTWDAVRQGGTAVVQSERLAADEWLNEALAEALDRLERVRLRAASLAELGAPLVIRRSTPPPLPVRRPTSSSRHHSKDGAAPDTVLELDPVDG